jgi:nucleoid-associated protein YgaU
MTKTTVFLQLDDVVFDGVEIPSEISFGAKQNIVVHDLIGGTRVVDAMGFFSAPLSWSGMFVGPQALERVRYLLTKLSEGKKLTLTWSELRYQVIMSEFKPVFQREYQIPYSITLEVIKDESQTQSVLVNNSVDALIDYDAIAAADMVAYLQTQSIIHAGSVSTNTMAGLFSGLQTAIKAVSSFANATQSQLNSVLQPLAAVRSQIKTLMASVNNTLTNVTTLGGILPGNHLSRQVAQLGAQLSATRQYPALLSLDRALGRISVNAQASYKTDRRITQAGGNLYEIAAKEYGDPLAWTALAKANALTDPQLTGVNTLVIPPAPGTSTGILES